MTLMRVIFATIALVGIIAAYLVANRPNVALATTPPPCTNANLSVAQHAARSDVIVVGTVHSVTPRAFAADDAAVLLVEAYYKGGDGASTIIAAGYGRGYRAGIYCRVEIAVGERYVFWLADDGSGVYQASYGSSFDAVLAPTDAALAELAAAVGDGVPPRDQYYYGDLLEGTLEGMMTATSVRRATDSQNFALTQTAQWASYTPQSPVRVTEYLWDLTQTALAAHSLTLTPAAPTTDTRPPRATSGSMPAPLGSLMLCLSTTMGPLAVLMAVHGRRSGCFFPNEQEQQ